MAYFIDLKIEVSPEMFECLQNILESDGFQSFERYLIKQIRSPKFNWIATFVHEESSLSKSKVVHNFGKVVNDSDK